MKLKSQLASRLVAVSSIIPLALVALAVQGSTAPGTAASPPNPWSFTANVAVKETYDNNVFLQNVGPNANKESFITTVIPSVSVKFNPADAFNATVNYAPEVNGFHSEPGENFTLHRIGLNLGGKPAAHTTWDFSNNLICIDGSDISPIYANPDGAPAAGGPAVRDRRDAVIYRSQFKLTHTIGQWIVRPVASAYYHDFMSEQTPTVPGYLNCVDRNDFNGGVDIGNQVSKNIAVLIGYRYGQQDQSKSPVPGTYQYDNSYHRVLFGVEGKPLSWLKLALSLGPEFRAYGDLVSPAFKNDDETYLYVDSSITIIPCKNDTLTLSAKRFEQPGFTGNSTYIDSTYDLTWRHALSEKLTIGAGVRGYNTDFLLPAVRNDWIITGSALVAYKFNAHFSSEVSWSYDDAQNALSIPKPGREYTRHAVALGLKYTLR